MEANQVVELDVVATDNTTPPGDLTIKAAWSKEALRTTLPGAKLELTRNDQPGARTAWVEVADRAGNAAMESLSFFVLADAGSNK